MLTWILQGLKLKQSSCVKAIICVNAAHHGALVCLPLDPSSRSVWTIHSAPACTDRIAAFESHCNYQIWPHSCSEGHRSNAGIVFWLEAFHGTEHTGRTTQRVQNSKLHRSRTFGTLGTSRLRSDTCQITWWDFQDGWCICTGLPGGLRYLWASGTPRLMSIPPPA